VPLKQFDLTVTQKRLLVQLWASPGERNLFAVMSKQWVDDYAVRMVERCEPEELLQLRAAWKSIRDFFATVHNTAVAAGLPGRIPDDSPQAGQEVGGSALPRQEAR
jgi:hypothetical protein